MHLTKLAQGHQCSCKQCNATANLQAGHLKHGLSKHAEHRIWVGMIDRCTNPRNSRYHRYGGRGIRVCQEWRESFEVFMQHVGPRPSNEHQLDRIDNDENYEPGNVQWLHADDHRVKHGKGQIRDRREVVDSVCCHWA